MSECPYIVKVNGYEVCELNLKQINSYCRRYYKICDLYIKGKKTLNS